MIDKINRVSKSDVMTINKTPENKKIIFRPFISNLVEPKISLEKN